MDLRALPFCAVLAVFMLLACDKRATDASAEGNPADPKFDLAHSDPAAVELADSIMLAMGGRAAWNDIRFVRWQPASARTIFWDKQKGRIRLEIPDDGTVILLETRTGKGRMRTAAGEITQPDSLKRKLQYAMNLWQSDSLWLFLPFNLKGAGITLRYLGEGTLAASGRRCNLLELTLRPPAKDQYLLYVDMKDNLIKQWAYSKNSAHTDSPDNFRGGDFARPWDNYKRYGAILLSADRTDHTGPRNVSLPENLAEAAFTEF